LIIKIDDNLTINLFESLAVRSTSTGTAI